MPDSTSPEPVVWLALTRAVLAELLAPGRRDTLERVATGLDRGVDAVVLGADVGTRHGDQQHAPGIDPSIAAIALAHRTARVGVVVAASPRRDHPYNVARRLASIDHASAGRAGLLVGVDDAAAAPGSPWTAAGADVAAADAVTAVRELWRSFPVDTIVADQDRGVFAESHRILAVDHTGPAYSVSGPLQVPWSPQVWPPVVAWRSTGEGSPLAAVVDLLLDDDPSDGIHRPGDVAELSAWLDAAPPVTGRTTTLRSRLGLAPARPPTTGRPAFDRPAEGRRTSRKEAAGVR